MNAQQAENLRILINHMETRVTRTLSMGEIFNDCGTPACALGEAWTLDALRGQFIEKPRLSAYAAMCREVFGVTDHGPLFGGSFINAWEANYVTPKAWAAQARKVLAEHGYSMEDAPASAPAKPDAFAAFMVKVQEPRPEFQTLFLERL